LDYLWKNSRENIFTSYIGIGVDFNTEVTENIVKVKGSNYFCISTEAEFKKMLDDEFNYNFFPCAFDVKLNVTSANPDYTVSKVYGTGYENEMVNKQGSWSPCSHVLYDRDFRDLVVTFLLCCQRNDLPVLPNEILSQIFNYMSPPKVIISEINTLFPSKIRKWTNEGRSYSN